MILCAAIKVSFMRDGEPVTVVIPGHRHSDVWCLMAMLEVPSEGWKTVEGFINHEGEFLDRHEAFIHALNCGQISSTTMEHKEEHFETELYSEDLY